VRPFGELDDPRRRILIQALAAGFFSSAGTAAALSIDSELLELGISTLRYRHTMRDAETQQTLSTMERLRAFVVLGERRPIALPPIVARRAQLLFPAVAVHSGTRAEAQPAASLID